MRLRFAKRAEAGRLLAAELRTFAQRPRLLVLGLPRGGVPVAYEIAVSLNAPLDIFIARKLGVPGHEELAMGAIATGGICCLNQSLIDTLRIRRRVLDEVIAREREELGRREQAFRRGPPPDLCGRTLILIDDGLATGASMRATVMAARRQQPAAIIVAVPVAAPDTLEQLRCEVDEAVCLLVPEEFHAVGEWYEDFTQTTDAEVRALLERAALRGGK